MRLKVDPRTGRIIEGRPTPSAPASGRGRKQIIQAPAPAMIDMKLMLEIARTMGKVIAEEMKNASPATIAQQVSAKTGLPEETVEAIVKKTIEIDESIADVGIGDVAELKRGEESAELVAEETDTDESLSSSKDKLRALKNRG